MTDVKLKPCPFCGAAPKLFVNFKHRTEKHDDRYIDTIDGYSFRVMCGNFQECNGGSPCTNSFDTEAEAAEAWNTRYTDEVKE